MSRPKNAPPLVTSLDAAVPVKPMTLSGVVKTTRGYAVAVAVIAPDGSVQSVKLGHSQAFREYVAAEHKGSLGRLANSA